MAKNDRRTELTIALIDQVTGPAGRVSRAVAELGRETARSERAGSRAGTRIAAGIERGLAPLGSTLGPRGRVGAELLAGHTATAGAMSRVALANSMTMTRAYDGAAASAVAAARAILPFAAALGVGKGVAAAADFESSLTEIQKKSGASADEVRRVGEEIKALSVSGRVASSIEDVAAAYARGAAAGIPLAELATFAELSVKAADGFEMSAEAVGNFAAKLSTSLGMSEDQVRRTFDLINSLADSGIADERDLVDFQDRTGATLKTLGLASEQGLALGATLLNIGMRSEVAATASGALASRLLTVGTLTGKARKSFSRVMGPVDDFAKLVEQDANGALLKLLDRLQELPAAEKAAFLKDFVGAEWADEMIRLSEATDEYRRNLRLAGNEAEWLGSLERSYQLKLDDFWSQWQIVKNAVQKLAINLATPGMPALVAGLERAVALTEEIDAGFQQMRLRLDWSELGDAKKAVGELADEIGRALGADTSGSTIDVFFRDLAVLVNELAGVVATVSRELKDIAAFARDPLGELTRERTPEELARHGITKLAPEEVARLKAERERTVERPASDARERSLADYERGDGLVTPPPTPPAEKGGRVAPAAPGPDPARFDPTPFPGEAAMADLTAGLDALAAALQARAAGATAPSPAAPATVASVAPAVPMPTPRPDIADALRAEGGEASAEAARIAAKLVDVLSVTAAPTIDASSILTALGAANRLGAALRSLPSLSSIGGSAIRAPSTGAPPLPRRAGGGAVRRGPYLVGEQGPEVVHVGGNGYVTPNHRLPAGGGVMNNTFNISSTDPKDAAHEIRRQLDRFASRTQQIGINR